MTPAVRVSRAAPRHADSPRLDLRHKARAVAAARGALAAVLLAAALLGTLGTGAGTLAQLGAGGAQAQSGPESRGAATESADTSAADGLPRDSRDKLAWGADFLQWTRVTGYLFSRNHGQRLASVRATPPASAALRIANAERLRQQKDSRLAKYPVGTVLVMQTWELDTDLNRGASGPLFFMRKEAPGYDPEGGDWRYAMTHPDLSVLAEGKDGRATACRACHHALRDRDFVPALDR